MHEKYLYVKPDVFIRKDDKHILLYSTSLKKVLMINRNSSNEKIADELLEIRNFYCIKVEQDNHIEIINKICDNKFGEVILADSTHKPISIPPILLFANQGEKAHKKNIPFYDAHILEYLKVITIRLSGDCKHNCKNCQINYKQTITCTKSANSLTIDDLRQISNVVHGINIDKVQFVISRVDDISLLEKTYNLFSDESHLIVYYIHLKNATEDIIKRLINLSGNNIIKIIVDPKSLSDSDKINLEFFSKKYETMIFSFIVSNDLEMKFMQSCIENNQLFRRFEVNGVFDGDLEFFSQYFCLNNNELMEVHVSSDIIYKNQILNSNFWGQLYFEPDRTVRLNENYPSIGSIDTPLFDNLLKAFELENNPWLLTRHKTNCSRCAFCDICPPISNIEITMPISQRYACSEYHTELCL